METTDKQGVFSFTSIKNITVKTLSTLENMYDKQNVGKGLKTGFGWLEFQKDELIVLSGCPNVGKTALALSLIKQISIDNKTPTGLIVPGNFENVTLGQRLLSICSEVAIAKIRKAMLNMDEFEKIKTASNRIYDSPICIFNEPNCNFQRLKESAIEMAEQQEVKLIIVDGFEFLEEIVDAENENYRWTLEAMLDRFKALAVKLQIPTVLTLDLPNYEYGYEPRLLDFKKYMVIPNKADKVLLIYREFRDLIENGFISYANLIVAKNESGPTGDIRLKFLPKTALFENNEDGE